MPYSTYKAKYTGIDPDGDALIVSFDSKYAYRESDIYIEDWYKLPNGRDVRVHGCSLGELRTTGREINNLLDVEGHKKGRKVIIVYPDQDPDLKVGDPKVIEQQIKMCIYGNGASSG